MVNWCKGHGWVSTFIVIKLSYKRHLRPKSAIFRLNYIRLFQCTTVQISANSSSPPKWSFCLLRTVSSCMRYQTIVLFVTKENRNLFHPHGNHAQMIGWHEWDSTFMVTTVFTTKGLGPTLMLTTVPQNVCFLTWS